MMNEPPEDDSPDLTDEELEKAIPTGSPEDMASHLRTCPQCGGASFPLVFKKLRRGHHYYSRITVVCQAKQHETTRLFENTWFLNMRP